MRDPKPPVVVVYKKSSRPNAKVYLAVFEDVLVDVVIDGAKRKPLIPNEYELLEVGVGSKFIEAYKKKYKI